jgi:hypothetical protein
MAEPTDVDAERGIYPKYLVFKHPEEDFFDVVAYALSQGLLTPEVRIPLDLVEDFTFTLRPSKDYHARVALAAYAESVRHWNPKLAEDLEWAIAEAQSTPPRMEPT